MGLLQALLQNVGTTATCGFLAVYATLSKRSEVHPGTDLRLLGSTNLVDCVLVYRLCTAVVMLCVWADQQAGQSTE